MNIGIDVGGTNLKAGLVDGSGTILTTLRVPLGEFQGPAAFIETLLDLVRRTAEKAKLPLEQIESVGVGIPGAVRDGEILFTTNIPMQHVPLARQMREGSGLPVFLGNDADCAAVGEYFCGSGRGTADFAVVTLGTGIGGGLVLDGKLHTGLGCGGEVGHIVIVPGGELCNCGRRGCWERYGSATALIRQTQEMMDRCPDSAMRIVAEKNGCVDGRTAFEAAQAGDGPARRVCQTYVEYLAEGVTDLVNILHPERIAIGGGVSAAPEELLLRPLRELVMENCFGGRHGGAYTQIVRAELGNDAGIIGAAMLHRAV